MDIKFIESSRGKPMLVVNSYKYNLKKVLKTSNEHVWVCVDRKCKATIYTLGPFDQNVVLNKCELEHCHEADVASLERQIVSTSCKRKATEDIAEKPSKLIRKVLQENLPSTFTATDVVLVRNYIYNARRKFIPSLPKNIYEVHEAATKLDIKTSKGENFLFVNSVNEKIIVFSCETNVRMAATTNRIYLDGTFNYCTQYFCQLFTIHGFFNGHYIPLFFCLLPSKQTHCYFKLFSLIENECLKYNVTLNINEVVVDFEQGIHKAVNEVWPEAQIIGCRFHLSQAWYRKVQKLGLTKEYQDKSNLVGQWMRTTFALPYLDPSEVGDSFALDLFDIMPNDERLLRYADYLTDNYISEESAFPPIIWAKMSATLARTTNACESFHSHFNSSMYKAHPNFFVFVEKLSEFQISTQVKIQSVNSTAKINNNKVKKRQEFIEKTINRYKSKEISRLHLLKCISFHAAPV